MSTLLEFIKFTKGVEYLIAIAFLFGFIAFWQLVYHKRKGLIWSVAPGAILALCFAVLAARCISTQAVATAPPPTTGTPFLCSAVLTEMYGPASFDHELHEGIANDCTLCHHNSGDRVPPCKECHAAPFSSGDLDKPGLAHVYHLRCISCHKENQEGPTECTGCHSKATVPPLSIAHAVTGVENCLGCHKAGIAGVPVLPDDHAGATNGVCQLCHQLAPEAPTLAAHAVPHEVVMRGRCLLCHGEGVAGASQVPTDHAGRGEDTCLVCHTPAVEEETLAQAPSNPAGPQAAVGPMLTSSRSFTTRKILHDVAGREHCLMCHGEGIKGARPVPADHAGRVDEACRICHVPSSTAGTAAGEQVGPPRPSPQGESVGLRSPVVSHLVAGERWHCNMCHTQDGLLPAPENHRNYTEHECTNCHKLELAAPEGVSSGS